MSLIRENNLLNDSWVVINPATEDNQTNWDQKTVIQTLWEDVSVQNPFPTNGDSVYAKDIWTEESITTNWVDEDATWLDVVLIPFTNLHTRISNTTSDNPKILRIHFNRTISLDQVWLWCVWVWENFSNAKIIILGSWWVERTVLDNSSDDTKYTSRNYQFWPELWNAIQIEFHTTDSICLSNITIQKVTKVSSQLRWLDQNQIMRDIRSTEVGNLMTSSFLVEVSRGNIPWYSIDRKFGSVASIQAAVPADVWSYWVTSWAESYTFSADWVADIDRISSDALWDTWILITVVWLDVDWIEVSQTIALDWTDARTPVALTTSLWRVNRAFNANWTDLIGNVYVFVDWTTAWWIPSPVTLTRAYIPVWEWQTLQAVYTVPAGKTAYFMWLEASLTKAWWATAVWGNFRWRTRTFWKVFRTQDDFDLISTWASNRTHNFSIPLPFLEKTDFVPTVDVTNNGAGSSWAFTMLLINN